MSGAPFIRESVNLFVGDNGLIRVKCKFSKWKHKIKEFPSF